MTPQGEPSVTTDGPREPPCAATLGVAGEGEERMLDRRTQHTGRGRHGGAREPGARIEPDRSTTRHSASSGRPQSRASARPAPGAGTRCAPRRRPRSRRPGPARRPGGPAPPAADRCPGAGPCGPHPVEHEPGTSRRTRRRSSSSVAVDIDTSSGSTSSGSSSRARCTAVRSSSPSSGDSSANRGCLSSWARPVVGALVERGRDRWSAGGCWPPAPGGGLSVPPAAPPHDRPRRRRWAPGRRPRRRGR